MFSAEPADGTESSSKFAWGAMNFARSRPIWMYVPRSEAVTILNTASEAAIDFDAGQSDRTSAQTKVAASEVIRSIGPTSLRPGRLVHTDQAHRSAGCIRARQVARASVRESSPMPPAAAPSARALLLRVG